MSLIPTSRRSRLSGTVTSIWAGVLVALAAALSAGPPITAQAAGLSVRIVGNHFVDGSGRPVRLLGVNRSGSEYACMANWAVFDGPSDAASIAAMASWNIDAVRVPLNEDCWLGINGAPAAFSGANYRNAIAGYVSRLHAAGMYAIVDLHWNAQGSLPADGKTGQGRKMADLDHAPAFWTSVAGFFKNDHGVVFDLFNEPHDIGWDCWLNGCTTSDGTGTWQAAGMQTLLNAVRATGATNVVTLSANGWGGDIPQWLNYRPRDPAGQIAAGWHVYFPETFYSDPARWASAVLPVAAASPHSAAVSARPAGTTPATTAQGRSRTTVSFPAKASAMARNPGRALLIWVGSIALLAAPLGFTATRWFIRRRRRRRAAT